MPTVIVDEQEIEIGEGERLNGIQAAARVGIDIPRYCWHPGLSVVASCRMCLVESGRRDPATGKVSMIPKLIPACQTPATDGTIFVTNSEKVQSARAMVEEDLLIRHPIDCPICDKAGECNLQDYHFEHGQKERRADLKPFTSRRRPLGDTVTLFVDRCVMCSRCVRFCREVSGTSELMVTDRGAHEEIDIFPGYPLANKLSGNVVDLCPVGALGDVDFLYEQRVWFMKSHDNVCTGCSTGCSIKVEENQDQVYRLKPRENPRVNKWWMCDDGRYGWKYVHDKRRVTEPRWRVRNELVNIEWSELPSKLDGALRKAGHLAAVLSPHLTVEEAYMLAKYVREIDSDALLVLGHVPVEGEDEFIGVDFKIRSEKCPNRRGVEAIVARMGDGVVTWEEFLKRAGSEKIDALWLTAGYNSDWNSQENADNIGSIGTTIVQDIFPSPVWDQATIQLPGATFVEREGSYVNHDDRLQSFKWAIRPPAGVKVEGQLYWQLLNMPGLFNARKVLDAISREIGFFEAASDVVPPTGIDLKVKRLATK